MNLRHSAVSLILCWCSAGCLLGNSKPLIHSDSAGVWKTSEGGIDPLRLSLVAGGTVGGFVWAHALQNDLWWKGTWVPFHVNWSQDWSYALGADKLGHATFPFMASRAYGMAFRWCGMDTTASVWASSGLALAYQSYIEVRDGFSQDYGFSPSDMVANVLGAGLPVAQHYVPALRPFTLQVSFWPSQAFRQGSHNAIIDDYTSTTHWVSVTMADVVPSDWTWYPQWLNLAVGHSVENLDGKGGGNHVFLLSLDWNLQRLPGIPAWLRDVFHVLHTYHLPAPAVRLYPTVAWFGLRF